MPCPLPMSFPSLCRITRQSRYPRHSSSVSDSSSLEWVPRALAWCVPNCPSSSCCWWRPTHARSWSLGWSHCECPSFCTHPHALGSHPDWWCSTAHMTCLLSGPSPSVSLCRLHWLSGLSSNWSWVGSIETRFWVLVRSFPLYTLLHGLGLVLWNYFLCYCHYMSVI